MKKKIIGLIVLCSLFTVSGCSSTSSAATTASSATTEAASTAPASVAPTPTPTPDLSKLKVGTIDGLTAKLTAASAKGTGTTSKYCKYDSPDNAYLGNDANIQYCGYDQSSFVTGEEANNYGWEVSLISYAEKIRFRLAATQQVEGKKNNEDIMIDIINDGTVKLSIYDAVNAEAGLITFDADGKPTAQTSSEKYPVITYPAMTAENYKKLVEYGDKILAYYGMSINDVMDEAQLKYYTTEFNNQ